MVGQDAAPEISDLELLNELLLTHARRARYAHRALLSFYTSTGLFVLMVVLIGLAWLGIGALDRRFENILEVCRRMTDRRS